MDAEDKGAMKAIEAYEQSKAIGEADGTSARLFSPNVRLTGHQAAVYNIKFDSTGSFLASVGHDKRLFLWDIFDECKNILATQIHKNAILDLRWSIDDNYIYTCSADKTVSIFDLGQSQKVKKF